MGTRRLAKARARRLLGGTREALIEAAFELLADQRSFDALSLRELTRAVGIVPTAFYRHFPDMEALGLALVEDAFRALRKVLAAVREDLADGRPRVGKLVSSVLTHVQRQSSRFRFIVAERYGGSPAVRDAIGREIRLVQAELSLELARLPPLKAWPAADLHMLAMLLFNTMAALVEEILARGADRAAVAEWTEMAEKQLRLILLGAGQWRPGAAVQ